MFDFLKNTRDTIRAIKKHIIYQTLAPLLIGCLCVPYGLLRVERQVSPVLDNKCRD